MKASRLAEILLDDPDFEVIAFDADAGAFVPVTGIVVDSFHREFTIHTDED